MGALVGGAENSSGSTGALVLPAGFQVGLEASGFVKPTAFAFAPDGRWFVADKDGRVWVVNPPGVINADGTTQKVLLDIRNEVNSNSDRGLNGIALDKNFATNGLLYLLYVYELQPSTPDQGGPMVSRLTRVTVTPSNTVSPETVVLGTYSAGPCPTADNAVDCIPADFYWHTIGTVRSDPTDGTLWLGSGDTTPDRVDPQAYRTLDEHSFAGKLIHIDRNGKGLPGHPFCPADTDLTHVCTKIYAMGFRNPFRFTLREGKGPIVGDVGASGYEELDLVEPGKNYGWPCYEGPVRHWNYTAEPRCLQEYAKEGDTLSGHRADLELRAYGRRVCDRGACDHEHQLPARLPGRHHRR